MRHLGIALLLLSSSPTTRAAPPPDTFSEPAAVLLNVSERDLNRLVVDSFHAKGGPRFEGEKKRVSSGVSDLRYHALFSDPVVRLGKDGTARLSLDIRDASLRIGQFEREIGGLQTRCEEAGLEVDPERPLAVEVALDLAVENGALRVNPRSVDIPAAEERLRLVEPARCSNTLLPRWFLWWLGTPYLRRSVGNLDEVILERARTSAARLEKKASLLTKRWEFPKHRGKPGSSLHLLPDSLDTSGGSLLLGLTASGPGPGAAARPAPPQRFDREASRASGSFLGLSESFVNEIARRVTFDASSSRRKPGSLRKLRGSDAVYALVPGLRGLDTKDNVYFEITFPSAPRFEFRPLDAGGSASAGSQALIRVLLTGVEINVRKDEAGRMTTLGTLRVDAGRMAVVPFANRLGGISFRLLENQWQVSSTGLEFDRELVAATLQELTFGKIFTTSYEPLLKRELTLGGTEFRPNSFAVNGGYLVIGLGAPTPSGVEVPAVAATRIGTLPGSR